MSNAEDADIAKLADEMIVALEEVARRATEHIKGSSLDPRVLGLLLLIRSSGSLFGALNLYKQGLPVEARILLRSCLENSFCIAALIETPEKFVASFKDDDDASRKAQAKALLAVSKYAETDVAMRGRMEAVASSIEKVRNLSIPELAKDGPLREFYLLYKVISHDAAHPSAKSLLRHMLVRDDKAGWHGYRWGADASEIADDTLSWLILVGGSIGIGATQLLGDDEGNIRIGTILKKRESLLLG